MSKSFNKGRTLGDIYNKVNHNKYSHITKISGKSELKSNYKNFIINYKFLIIVLILILLCLLIYTFKDNLILVVYCLGLLLLLFLFSIYNCTYKLKLDENSLDLQVNFQKTQILTRDLVNVYLSREKVRFFGFPIYSYTLNIIYIVNENLTAISLPTVMASRKQLMKLFSIFETEVLKNEEEEIQKEEKNKRTVILTIISVAAIVLLVASFIIAIISVIKR